jgi:hypothetical protein
VASRSAVAAGSVGMVEVSTRLAGGRQSDDRLMVSQPGFDGYRDIGE